VRRAVVEEAVVVGVVGLAPAALGVVAGLVGQHGRLFRLEVDLALGVVIAFGLVQDVHEQSVCPHRCDRRPPPAVPSVNVSSPTGVPDDDAYWQRPDPNSPGPRPAAPEPADPASTYQGPPRQTPPPPHWRPPTIAQAPPPRALPPQNMEALDDAEGSARTVTYGIGMVAGAIALILMCLLCARVIF
jgi:hypothetical protein